MDPETVKAKERKERFQQWLPGSAAGGNKSSKDAVAAAIGTSLDNSMPAKGRGKGKQGSAPEEKFSAEFTAKAEVGCLSLLHMLMCHCQMPHASNHGSGIFLGLLYLEMPWVCWQ